MEGLLDDFWLVLPADLFNALREVIPAVADALLGHSHGEQRLIRYPPGRVYKLVDGKVRKLEDTEVDPKKVLNTLSLAVWAVSDHNAEAYQTVVEQLPNDQK